MERTSSGNILIHCYRDEWGRFGWPEDLCPDGQSERRRAVDHFAFELQLHARLSLHDQSDRNGDATADLVHYGLSRPG